MDINDLFPDLRKKYTKVLAGHNVDMADIKVGMVFNTPFESCLVMMGEMEPHGVFGAYDCEGVEVACGVTMVTWVHPMVISPEMLETMQGMTERARADYVTDHVAFQANLEYVNNLDI